MVSLLPAFPPSPFIDWRQVRKPVTANFVVLRCRNANIVRLSRTGSFKASCKNVCDSNAHFHLQHAGRESSQKRWMCVLAERWGRQEKAWLISCCATRKFNRASPLATPQP